MVNGFAKQKFQAIEKLAEFWGRTRIETDVASEEMKFHGILEHMKMLK